MTKPRKRMTPLEETNQIKALFEKWWDEATKNSARYQVDFGCWHAYEAGYKAAIKAERNSHAK